MTTNIAQLIKIGRLAVEAQKAFIVFGSYKWNEKHTLSELAIAESFKVERQNELAIACNAFLAEQDALRSTPDGDDLAHIKNELFGIMKPSASSVAGWRNPLIENLIDRAFAAGQASAGEDSKRLDWLDACRRGIVNPPENYPGLDTPFRQAIDAAIEQTAKGQQ